ncbi:MAG: hypothetical protein H7245_20320 [Candidatus Saccharibacteria bacterium]|nr:hypothetical protein [Pseudorhodobacter sp.]
MQMKHTSKCSVRVYDAGPFGVAVINLGHQSYTSHHCDSIAQAVMAPVIRADFQVADALDQTGRGDGGYGSTGLA